MQAHLVAEMRYAAEPSPAHCTQLAERPSCLQSDRVCPTQPCALDSSLELYDLTRGKPVYVLSAAANCTTSNVAGVS
jgi:hypothetical protein